VEGKTLRRIFDTAAEKAATHNRSGDYILSLKGIRPASAEWGDAVNTLPMPAQEPRREQRDDPGHRQRGFHRRQLRPGLAGRGEPVIGLDKLTDAGTPGNLTSVAGDHRHQFVKGGIRKTVSWYLDNMSWVEHVASGDYRAWLDVNDAARHSL